MGLRFFIRGFFYLVLALWSAAVAWFLSGLLSSYFDTDIIRPMLLVATAIALTSQWYFYRSFPAANINSADYACNTIGVVDVVGALYAFLLPYYGNLYMTYHSGLANLIEGASAAADQYSRKFCLNADGTPKLNSPDASATCQLTQKIEAFLNN
jgi:hypothetical protein